MATNLHDSDHLHLKYQEQTPQNLALFNAALEGSFEDVLKAIKNGT
jgi:hypothetical protein